MAIRRSTYIVLFLIALIKLTGCTQPLNDRLTLGGSYLSPTLGKHSDNHTSLETPSQSLLASTPKPRADWTPTQYISPMDSVAHSQTFLIFVPPKKTDRPRIYGRFPTRRDALKSHSSPTIVRINDTLITFYELGRSLIGAPYALGYLTITGKLTEPVASPSQSYKRTETANTWSTGFPTLQAPTKEPADE